jgi:hypothetical protein
MFARLNTISSEPLLAEADPESFEAELAAAGNDNAAAKAAFEKMLKSIEDGVVSRQEAMAFAMGHGPAPFRKSKDPPLDRLRAIAAELDKLDPMPAELGLMLVRLWVALGRAKLEGRRLR